MTSIIHESAATYSSKQTKFGACRGQVQLSKRVKTSERMESRPVALLFANRVFFARGAAEAKKKIDKRVFDLPF